MPLSKHVAVSLDGVSAATADAALEFVRAIPAAKWGKVLPRSEDNTRLRFGPQEFYRGKSGGAVPPPLAALGEEAFEAVRASLPAELAAAWRPANCLVNKYAAKKGVAKHRDPGTTWAPLVIGVTLYEDRFDTLSAMQFETLPDAPKLEKVRVGTPHRSVYAFYGSAFSGATHARLPGSAKQRRLIYSCTFRCGVDELGAAAGGAGEAEANSEADENSEEAYWREEAEEAAERMRAEREPVAEFKVGQEVARIAHGGHLAGVATVAKSIDPPERLDEAAIALPRDFEEGIARFESKGEEWHLSGQSSHTRSWPQLREKLRSVAWYRVEWRGPAPPYELMTEILPEFALAERVQKA